VSFLALTDPFASDFFFLVFKLYWLHRLVKFTKSLYHGHVAIKKKEIIYVWLKPKNTRVAYRDTPDTNEAQDSKKR
jgi:hypothetical protein